MEKGARYLFLALIFITLACNSKSRGTNADSLASDTSGSPEQSITAATSEDSTTVTERSKTDTVDGEAVTPVSVSKTNAPKVAANTRKKLDVKPDVKKPHQRHWLKRRKLLNKSQALLLTGVDLQL
jgi:hypothetical protein